MPRTRAARCSARVSRWFGLVAFEDRGFRVCSTLVQISFLENWRRQHTAPRALGFERGSRDRHRNSAEVSMIQYFTFSSNLGTGTQTLAARTAVSHRAPLIDSAGAQKARPPEHASCVERAGRPLETLLPVIVHRRLQSATRALTTTRIGTAHGPAGTGSVTASASSVFWCFVMCKSGDPTSPGPRHSPNRSGPEWSRPLFPR